MVAAEVELCRQLPQGRGPLESVRWRKAACSMPCAAHGYIIMEGAAGETTCGSKRRSRTCATLQLACECRRACVPAPDACLTLAPPRQVRNEAKQPAVGRMRSIARASMVVRPPVAAVRASGVTCVLMHAALREDAPAASCGAWVLGCLGAAGLRSLRAWLRVRATSIASHRGSCSFRLA